MSGLYQQKKGDDLMSIIITQEHLEILLKKVQECGKILESSELNEAPVIIGMLVYCGAGGDRALYRQVLKAAIRVYPELYEILEEI